MQGGGWRSMRWWPGHDRTRWSARTVGTCAANACSRPPRGFEGRRLATAPRDGAGGGWSRTFWRGAASDRRTNWLSLSSRTEQERPSACKGSVEPHGHRPASGTHRPSGPPFARPCQGPVHSFNCRGSSKATCFAPAWSSSAAVMAGRVSQSAAQRAWEAWYPRPTGPGYDADLRVGLYATEAEAQVGASPLERPCAAPSAPGIANCGAGERPGALRSGFTARRRPARPCRWRALPARPCTVPRPTAEGGGPAAPESRHRQRNAAGAGGAAPAPGGEAPPPAARPPAASTECARTAAHATLRPRPSWLHTPLYSLSFIAAVHQQQQHHAVPARPRCGHRVAHLPRLRRRAGAGRGAGERRVGPAVGGRGGWS